MKRSVPFADDENNARKRLKRLEKAKKAEEDAIEEHEKARWEIFKAYAVSHGHMEDAQRWIEKMTEANELSTTTTSTTTTTANDKGEHCTACRDRTASALGGILGHEKNLASLVAGYVGRWLINGDMFELWAQTKTACSIEPHVWFFCTFRPYTSAKTFQVEYTDQDDSRPQHDNELLAFSVVCRSFCVVWLVFTTIIIIETLRHMRCHSCHLTPKDA